MTWTNVGSLSVGNGPQANVSIAYSAIIDFTTTGTYVIIPATPSRIRILNVALELKTVGGTRSVAPTCSIGSNSSAFDNYINAGAAAAGILSQAAETLTGFAAAVNPVVAVDLTTSGLQINVSAALTGSSPVCTGVVVVMHALVPV